jgi:hypothetical protein
MVYSNVPKEIPLLTTDTIDRFWSKVAITANKELLAEGGSQKEISLLYKVTQSLISRINSRYYWNHI